jgi:hypothetical protein
MKAERTEATERHHGVTEDTEMEGRGVRGQESERAGQRAESEQWFRRTLKAGAESLHSTLGAAGIE